MFDGIMPDEQEKNKSIECSRYEKFSHHLTDEQMTH